MRETSREREVKTLERERGWYSITMCACACQLTVKSSCSKPSGSQLRPWRMLFTWCRSLVDCASASRSNTRACHTHPIRGSGSESACLKLGACLQWLYPIRTQEGDAVRARVIDVNSQAKDLHHVVCGHYNLCNGMAQAIEMSEKGAVDLFGREAHAALTQRPCSSGVQSMQCVSTSSTRSCSSSITPVP